MFETTNSIEPAIPQRARQKEQPIREATSAEMAKLMRRDKPVKAARNWFQRAPKAAAEPDEVSKRHGLYVAQNRDARTYFADYQQKSEVMRAQPAKISSKLSDRQTVTAMLDLAQSRGWNKVNLKGTEEFKREAWVQAQVRGIMTEGHKASDTDKQEVARRKQASGVAEVAAKITTAITAKAPPAVKADTQMMPKEQPKDYERVNGAADRARAVEVKQHGPGGYKGDPGVNAAEKKADIQGDATMQPLPKVRQSKRNQIAADVWGNVEAVGAKVRAQEAAKHGSKQSQKPAVTA